jgi:hypothetical protein
MSLLAPRRSGPLTCATLCAIAATFVLLVPARASADLTASGIVHHPPATSVADPGRWIIPGREIVIYRPGVHAASAASAAGGSVIASIPELNAVVLRRPRHRALASAASMRGVLAVEPDVRLVPDDADCTLTSACVVPNDPGFVDQWYLENDRATVEPVGGAGRPR